MNLKFKGKSNPRDRSVKGKFNLKQKKKKSVKQSKIRVRAVSYKGQ